MFVRKRDGRKEPVMFDKITSRIQKLCYGLNMDYIDPPTITLKVINGVDLHSGVSTVELDNLAAEIAVTLSSQHAHYAVLAARIEMSNLHKETKKSFSEVVEDLYQAGNKNDMLHRMNEKFYIIVKNNEDVLNSLIIYDRDFSYTYFGIKVLEKYLKKICGKIVERPQHMFMRMAIATHGEDINAVAEMYNLLSEKWFMAGDSLMTNAAFNHGQLMSGYALTMESDSIEGIYNSLEECGLVARSGGTVGFNIHCIRATGSYIAGTNGTSNGIMPMLRVYNSMAKLTHHCGRNESAAITVYLEPWHADILDFLSLKKSTGKDERRARELMYAVWIPDLFMKRTEADGDWCLMSPNESNELQKLFGKDFEEQYLKFEADNRFMRKVKAREVWYAIIESQMENGGPMMLYKDNFNCKSNFKNVGTILSSGYSGELLLHTSAMEAPGCSSGIISLNMFVENGGTFNFSKLKDYVKGMTVNLDKLIDSNSYPIEKSRSSVEKTRPIAISVQGLADAFILMRYPFESEEAKLLNKQIFETIYYGAMEASCELAQKFGPYELYEGSPISKGVFQFDLWDATPSPLQDWSALREKVVSYGVRNAVLVACKPCAVAAKLNGCSAGLEPLFSNVHNEQIATGVIKVVNPHLLKDLAKLGLWDVEMEAAIKDSDGSIQNIELIPEDLKKLYKTVWEISQKTVLEMAADRGAFIDQSQSFIVHISNPNYAKITSMHFYGWKLGLKTGMLSLKTRKTAAKPSVITLKDVEVNGNKINNEEINGNR